MDVVALYPSIPHEYRLETLRQRLVKSEDLKLPVNDIVKMGKFALRITSLSLMGRLSSKLQKQQLVLNLLCHLHG